MGASREDLIRADLEAPNARRDEPVGSFVAAVRHLEEAQRESDRRLGREVYGQRLGFALESPMWSSLGRDRVEELFHAARATRFASPHLVGDVFDVGLRETVDTGDLARVASGLVASHRVDVFRSLHVPSGTDHSQYLFVAIETFATGDVELARELLPEVAGPTKEGHRFMVVGSNLVREIVHGLGGPRSAAVAAGERFAAAKSHPVMEKRIVSYLVAVALGDPTRASSALGEIDADWLSSPWLRERRGGVMRRFGPLLHGLYGLGVEHLPGGRDGLPVPTSGAFWPEYDAFVRDPGRAPLPRALVFSGETAPLGLMYGPFAGA